MTKTTEEFKIDGADLVKKVKELLHEGNIRKLIIKNEEGKTIVEIPVTYGAIGVLVAPVLAMVGALTALLTKCSIVVERKQ